MVGGAKGSGPRGGDIDRLAVDTLRMLAVDAVERANSGHPGMPMGAAPMAHVLWTRHLKYDPASPGWADRDRFVLSAGHGSMLLYGLLHLWVSGWAWRSSRPFVSGAAALRATRNTDSPREWRPPRGHLGPVFPTVWAWP